MEMRKKNRENTNQTWTQKKTKPGGQNKYSKNDILDGVIIKTLTTRKSNNRIKNNNVGRQKFPQDALPDIETPKTTYKDIPQDIRDPILALYDEDIEKPIDFDDAIEKLKKTQELTENEDIVYIGRGEFAVVVYVTQVKQISNNRSGNNKNTNKRVNKIETKVLEIRRKIVFERRRESLEWRNELCFGLSLFYKPNPEPLSALYTEKEAKTFFRFN